MITSGYKLKRRSVPFEMPRYLSTAAWALEMDAIMTGKVVQCHRHPAFLQIGGRADHYELRVLQRARNQSRVTGRATSDGEIECVIRKVDVLVAQMDF